MILIVHGQQIVEHLNVAVIGKSKVTDAAGLALLDQPIEDAVVLKATLEVLHAAHADAMEQIVVDIVHLQFLQ